MNKYKIKGLKELFGSDLESVLSEISDSNIYSNVMNIKMDLIIPNKDQPRKKFSKSKIESLASSIRKNGLISPILLRRIEEKYEIIAGERRYRAFLLNKDEYIPAMILNINGEKALELALIENIVRENLNKVEEGIAFKTLIEKNNLTHDELSKRIKKSRSYITNLLRINKLDEKIIDALNENKVSFGKVKMLINLDKDKQLEIFKRINKEKLSTRDVEEIVSNIDDKKKEKRNYFSRLLNSEIKVFNKKIYIPVEDKEVLEKIMGILQIDNIEDKKNKK